MSPENVSPISIEDKSPTISSANIIIFSQSSSSFTPKTAPPLPFSAILINIALEKPLSSINLFPIACKMDVL